jgi:hypothetical protein
MALFRRERTAATPPKMPKKARNTLELDRKPTEMRPLFAGWNDELVL